jgi:hypothetical protein
VVTHQHVGIDLKAISPFWRAFVAALSSDFFVINNLDKDTGLINVSYSGEPERYLDCGQVKVGDNEYAGSRGNVSYQQWQGLKLFRVSRQLRLEGRMNILVQEIDLKTSTVTVNTRYVVNRQVTATDSDGRTHNVNDSASFNHGEDGIFNQQGFRCRSTGALERHVIGVAQRTFSTMTR